MSIFCIVRINQSYPLTTSGSYSREAGKEGGRLADEMWVSFGIFNILYRLNYWGFYFVYYHCNVSTIIELHFSQLFSS